MPHVPDLTAIRSGQNFRLPKPPRALQNLLLLLCSLLAGLLPLLLWASLILLWYYSPWQFSADISYLSLAMFAASPFCALPLATLLQPGHRSLACLSALAGGGGSLQLAFWLATAGKSSGNIGYQPAFGHCRGDVCRPNQQNPPGQNAGGNHPAA